MHPRNLLWFLLIFLYLTPLLFTVEAYTTGMDASVVIGHSTFEDTGTTSVGLEYPAGIISDGTRLLISDCNNNRVLIYNSFPATSGAAADVVIGQPSMKSSSSNQGGTPGANTLFCPSFMTLAGHKLIITDAYNNRVLIYNSIPTSNNASADVVIGQTNFTSRGWGTTSSKLDYPNGVFYDTASGKLLIADSGNNRVLIWNTIPTSNGTSADIVVGQANFTSGNANRGGSTASNTLSFPYNARIYNNKLFIADNSNNRILIFNSIPSTNGAAADVVVGQASMTSNSYNQGGSAAANTLAYPSDMFVDGAKLIVADSENSRVLIYNSIPSSHNRSADSVIGQADLTSDQPNRGGSVNNNTLSFNYGQLLASNEDLYIVDLDNDRVVKYADYSSATAASLAIGQPDLISSASNARPVASHTLNGPIAMVVIGSKFIVADQFNSRVLIYNSVPSTNGAAADVVIGQQDMSGSRSNQGESPAANTLSYPSGVATDGTRLFISDGGMNNRVLVYNTLPTTNNASADVVIGQPNFTTTSEGTTSSKFGSISGVSYDQTSGKLIITEMFNRVLIYNSVPTTNGAAADVVVGKANFTSSGCIISATAHCPRGTARIWNGKLIIPDYYRILIYNSVPTTNGAAADVVIGQVNMTTAVEKSAGANTLNGPRDTYYDGKRLFIYDSQNTRILIFDGIPTSNNASAYQVLGQKSLSTANNTVASASTINENAYYTGGGLFYYDNKLFVTDDFHNRILVFENTFPHTISLEYPSLSNKKEFNLKGSVVLGNGATSTFSKVQYSVGSNSFSGTWTDCELNSLSYTCGLSNLVEGVHNIYVRAVDSDLSYTAQASYPLASIKVDLTAPESNWTTRAGNTVTFEGLAGDDIETADVFPDFPFRATTDSSDISHYQVLLYPDQTKLWVVYLDQIPPVSPSGENEWKNEIVKVVYQEDGAKIVVKGLSDIYKLDNGAYKWKVRVHDKAGNYRDSSEKILRVNEKSTVFTRDLVFPLTLLQVGEKKDLDISTNHQDSNPAEISISTTTPTFYGITNVGAQVKLTVTKEGITEPLFIKETSANSESRFGINVTQEDGLSKGIYTVTLEAKNSNEDVVRLKEFQLDIGGEANAKVDNKTLETKVPQESTSNKPAKILPTKKTAQDEPRNTYPTITQLPAPSIYPLNWWVSFRQWISERL